MYVKTVKALDHWVLRAAANSLAREVAETVVPGGPAEQPPEHPEYFADIDDSAVRLTFDAPDRFRFPSPVASGSTVNDVVQGRFYAARSGADGDRKPPLAILLHGWNGEKGYQYQFPPLAWRLTRLGVAVATIELPYHGRRKPPRGEFRNFLSGDLSQMMGATVQAIADIRALVHWARGEGYRSIGLWGNSLGAWLGGLTACAEPLEGLVLITPVPRIDLAIEQLPFCRHIRETLKGKEITAERLNLTGRRPMLPPERILLIESIHDQFAPAETVEALWDSWGRPAIWRANHGHISVLLSPRINDRALRWLRKTLKTGPADAGS